MSLAKANLIERELQSIEEHIKRVEVKYPLYAKQLRTKLVRKRVQLQTIREQLAADAEQPEPSDNFADGGRGKKKP